MNADKLQRVQSQSFETCNLFMIYAIPFVLCHFYVLFHTHNSKLQCTLSYPNTLIIRTLRLAPCINAYVKTNLNYFSCPLSDTTSHTYLRTPATPLPYTPNDSLVESSKAGAIYQLWSCIILCTSMHDNKPHSAYYHITHQNNCSTTNRASCQKYKVSYYRGLMMEVPISPKERKQEETHILNPTMRTSHPYNCCTFMRFLVPPASQSEHYSLCIHCPVPS